MGDIASVAQVRKISQLLENFEEYKVNVELETLTKVQATYMIRVLLCRRIQPLLDKKVMELRENTVIRYKVSGHADNWTYTSFRQEVNGKMIDYDLEEGSSKINYQILEVSEEIDESVAKAHGLIIAKVEEKEDEQ